MHLHYSPFQFATDEQASDGHVVPVKKQIAKAKAREQKISAPKLMSCMEARSITGSPNAFISPNDVDTMRTIKSVFGC